ncbi:MAG: class I tRNA ligase family protein, partial [Clostridium sp.]|nr:class I tRNA ligase family protein [Clostridium sp.]
LAKKTNEATKQQIETDIFDQMNALKQIDGANHSNDLSELQNLLQPVDKWILSRFNSLVQEVTDNLDKFELGIALQKHYDFVWDEFCDWYIEMVKPRLYAKGEDTDTKNSRLVALTTLRTVLAGSLAMLHPYMPFLTEEIYGALMDGKSLMLSAWPKFDSNQCYPKEERAIETIKEAVRGIRNIRTSKNIPPSKKSDIYVISPDENIREIFIEGKKFFAFLAYANEIFIQEQVDETFAKEALTVVIHGAQILLPLAQLLDPKEEQERLQKEEARLRGELARANAMLGNERFVAKAPADKIEAEREKVKKYTAMLEEVQKLLN